MYLRKLKSLFLAGIGMLPTLGQSDWSHQFDLKSSVVYDNNWSNGFRSLDERSDLAGTLRIGSGARYQLSHTTSLKISGAAQAMEFEKYSQLSNHAFELSGSLNYKLGLGHKAWHFQPYGKIQYVDYNQNWRDAWDYRFGLSIFKNFSERFDATFLVESTMRRATSSYYDSHGHAANLLTHYWLTPRLVLSPGLGVRTGDVTVHELPLPNWQPIAPFTDVDTFDERFAVYRISGDTFKANIGLQYFLNNKSQFGIKVSIEKTVHDFRNYQNKRVELSYAYIF